MKYICLKTLREDRAKFLVECINKKIDNVIVFNKRYKIYDNVIVFYNEEVEDEICMAVSNIFRIFIEKYYEKKILLKMIKDNYCYLEEFEQNYINNIALKILEFPDYKIGNKREILARCFYKYLKSNNKVIIEGVANFRIGEYKKVLESIIEVSVISFLNI